MTHKAIPFKDYLTNISCTDRMTALVQARLNSEAESLSLMEWLGDYDFESEAEIIRTVKRLATEALSCPDMADKTFRSAHPNAEILYTRVKRIRTSNDGGDKFFQAVGKETWYNYVLKRRTDRAFDAMYRDSVPDMAKYDEAARRIRQIYNFTDTDMAKLRYFIVQVKSGESFPPSLRRMLYLWGKKKFTGKTTLGRILTNLLNGLRDPMSDEYKTKLAVELQVENFAVPRIATARCAFMDECFFSDMGKTYNTFKDRITSNDGTARLPYGQTFTWHGCPNYVAASNDPLREFIKDRDDRRYLAIEFRDKPVTVQSTALMELVETMCVNATVPEGWDLDTWANEIFEMANEQGERGVTIDDWKVFFEGSRLFNEKLEVMEINWQNRMANSNRLTSSAIRTKIIETIGQQAQVAQERKEIETAFEEVYGARAAGYNWWSLLDIRQRVMDILDDIGRKGASMPF